MERMRVRDVMTPGVLTVDPNAAARLAVQMMLWGGFRHLPVVGDGVLLGILSESDLCHVGGPGDRLVHELMSRELATTTPDEALADAAAAMAAARVSCMPVLDDGELAGLLTTTDVLAHLVDERPPRDDPTIGDIMSARSAPRRWGPRSRTPSRRWCTTTCAICRLSTVTAVWSASSAIAMCALCWAIRFKFCAASTCPTPASSPSRRS